MASTVECETTSNLEITEMPENWLSSQPAAPSPLVFTSSASTASTQVSPSTDDTLISSRWDLSSQTPHGGQEWRELAGYVDDFSVTTNPLGTPAGAIRAATNALKEIDHYPTADFEPAWTSLAQFLVGESKDADAVRAVKSRLLLGNGASELIDLAIRISQAICWRPGPFKSQYMEYERSATNRGMPKRAWHDKSAGLLCMVNPCNPTGDFFDVAEMKKFVEDYCNESGTTVIVDESMQPWVGPDWRSRSLTSQSHWVQRMYREKNVKVFVIHSWTKLWSCPGLRIGSLLTPTAEDAKALKKIQVPWSLNCCAVAFLDAVVRDNEYLINTWKVTSRWRAMIKEEILKIHPTWAIFGEPFLSFLWIDTKSVEMARFYVANCKKCGVPIRAGAAGYAAPTYIRVAVRRPESVEILLHALRAEVPSSP